MWRDSLWLTKMAIPEKSSVKLLYIFLTKSAIRLLLGRISSQQRIYPDAVQIIAGDFNHMDLKAELPKFYQHVKCGTRGANTLDKVYSNIKLGYRARPIPHLGQSDHLSLLLIPAYAPRRKMDPIIKKTVATWPDGLSAAAGLL